MSRFRALLPLLFITAAALLLRTIHLLHGQGCHPDERHIIMVAENLSLKDLNPKSFAYGSFPFYLLWVVKNALGSLSAFIGLQAFSEWITRYDGLFLIGRSLSALFGSVSVLLTYALSMRLYRNKSVSLLASALVAFNIFHLQLSRFFAFDIILATFVIGAVLLFTYLEKPYKLRHVTGAGVLFGLALGTKVSALALLIPLFFALFLKDHEDEAYSWGGIFRGWKYILAALIGTAALAFAAYLLVDPSILQAFGVTNVMQKVPIIVKAGLALFWLAILVLAILPEDLGGGDRIAALAQVAAIAFCTFLIVEPFAFFDYTTFVSHSHEQLTMVRGEWYAPYTWQYFDTTPYLYQLKQWLFYTMGIPTFIAVAAATIYLTVAQRWSRNDNERVLLSFVLPFFLTVGYYQVKFPRYLILLYPFCFILAAQGLFILGDWLKRNASPRLGLWAVRGVIAVVLAGTVARGFAQMTIYSHEHTYQAASRWIFDNVPARSHILGPHWDDKLPVSLPDFNTSIYSYEGPQNDIVFYEPETPQKLSRMAQQLSQAEYVIFPTPRMQGSVPRLALAAPAGKGTVPATTTLLQMLYSGDLGYRLVHTTKIEPRLGPIEFNDDLADESISVYDHPKASIFKKVEQLSSEELLQRVEKNKLLPHLPSMEEMLLRNFDGSPRNTQDQGTFTSILLWYLTVLLLGLLALPLASAVLPKQPALAAGSSKTLGLLILGLMTWYASYLTPLPLTQETVGSLLMMLVAIVFVFFALTDFASLRSLINRAGREFVVVELVFIAGFIIMLILRAYQPEIYWGEKPMDGSFFNYFARLQHVPPDDPWAAGRPLQYYYLGSYILGLLQKLIGSKPGVGYNLSLAVIGACHLAGLYGIMKTLTKRTAYAIAGAAGILFLSNLDVVYLALEGKIKMGFDLYWASSRTLKSPAINEYPFWAFLFGDLHAHLIALPFTVLALSLVVGLFLRDGSTFSPRLLPLKMLIGLSIGALFVLNSWDLLTYGSVAGLFFLSYWGRSFYESWNMRRWRYSLFLILVDVVLVALPAVVSAGPLLFEAAGSIQPSYGFVVGEEFNTGWEMFRVLGQFAPPIIILICLFALRSLREPRYRPLKLVCAILAASIPLLLALWTVLTPVVQVHASEIHWLIFLFFSICILLSALSAFRSSITREEYVPLLLVVAASVILCTVELHFLMDRSNTIFKFYHGLWTLFGIASFASVPMIVKCASDKKVPLLARAAPLAGIGIAVVFFSVALAGSVINLVSLLPFQRVEGPRPTLDGSAYLSYLDGDESRLIDWMNRTVKGTPTIIEAAPGGNASYGAFTRVAMHTGIPVVIGWQYHVSQRGTTKQEIDRRYTKLRDVYWTLDGQRAHDLAKSLDASYIVVGNLERREYRGLQSLEKFDTDTNNFTKVFESGSVKVYSVAKTH